MPSEAWAALQRAHALMLESVRNVHDDGLRRSYLSKVATNRDIVRAWLHEARARGLSDARRLAHLAIASDPGEPFKRLVDTGTRLNELRSDAALHEFLIDEITELSGAERVLLILETDGERRVAGAQLPAGEQAADLLRAITPWLDEARRTRAVSLRHGPDGADAVDQRSCLVAPLIAQNEVLGFIYADLEGAFGRFGAADRGLLAMLASQAAVAVANVQWAQGLEAKVAERTVELQAQRTQAEQRAAELAVINSIQEGLSSKLELQAVIDLVGEKLIKVFNAVVLRIDLYDRERDLTHYPFVYDFGERFAPPPAPGLGSSVASAAMNQRRPLVFNTVAELDTFRAGADLPYVNLGSQKVNESCIYAPLLIGGEPTGCILVGREAAHAFAASDVNVITTVAASLSVALQNARSFEAERQRAAELAVINSVQSGIAGSLDFQAIVDLVGDKVHEIFDAQAVGIAGIDTERQVLLPWYLIERGQRVELPHERPLNGFAAAMTRSGEPIVVNSDLARRSAEVGSQIVAGENPKSAMFVPLLVGGRVRGVVTLQNLDRENAFSDSDLRLLQTLAASLAVSLENARLFDETQEALERQTATRRDSAHHQRIAQRHSARLQSHRRRRAPSARRAVRGPDGARRRVFPRQIGSDRRTWRKRRRQRSPRDRPDAKLPIARAARAPHAAPARLERHRPAAA